MTIAQMNKQEVRGNLASLLKLGNPVEIVDYSLPFAGLLGAAQAAELPQGGLARVALGRVRDDFKELLDRANGGETILLTRRDDVAGALVPLTVLYGVAAPPAAAREPRVITFWNEAGGAGKSTLVAELGAVLAQRQRPDGLPNRVLLIDADPQRTLTHRMGLSGGENNPAERLGRSINNVLQDRDAELPEPFAATGMPELSVIPGHASLRFLEGRISQERSFLNLRTALRRGGADYDFILIDTPPSNGDITRAAIIAADEVVIPVPTHIKGVENFVNVNRVFGECQETCPDVRLLALVPVAYNKGRDQDRQILDILREDYAGLAPTTRPIVERSGVYRNVIPLRSAIVRKYPRSPAATELNEVVDELLALMGVEA